VDSNRYKIIQNTFTFSYVKIYHIPNRLFNLAMRRLKQPLWFLIIRNILTLFFVVFEMNQNS